MLTSSALNPSLSPTSWRLPLQKRLLEHRHFNPPSSCHPLMWTYPTLRCPSTKLHRPHNQHSLSPMSSLSPSPTLMASYPTSQRTMTKHQLFMAEVLCHEHDRGRPVFIGSWSTDIHRGYAHVLQLSSRQLNQKDRRKIFEPAIVKWYSTHVLELETVVLININIC